MIEVTIPPGNWHGLGEAISAAGFGPLEQHGAVFYAQEGAQSIIDAWTPADSLTAVVAQQWEQIKAHRDALKDLGVRVGANVFHSDAASRTQQLGLVLLGASIPEGLQWKTKTGSFVTMTPTLAGQILGATALRDTAVFAVAEGHRLAMQALTHEEAAAYDWHTGWPEV